MSNNPQRPAFPMIHEEITSDCLEILVSSPPQALFISLRSSPMNFIIFKIFGASEAYFLEIFNFI